MNDQPTQRSVTLLKELLFEPEARRLEELDRRLQAEALAARQRDKSITERLDIVFERTGTEERLLRSVSIILDGALREAEIQRHGPLSKAIAPLVVSTIKIQLRESQDEMVDALYPITGRLVKSYVQAEISRLMIEINAKLGGKRPAELAAQSAATGITPAELALADTNRLQVEEIFLVRRGSGDLIAHWEHQEADNGRQASESASGSNRDVLLSGYISGIMTLSEEGFGASPGSFRTLTFATGDRIFVRGSAAHLLAVRCRGSAPAHVEGIIDQVFLDALERYQKILVADAAGKRSESAAGRTESQSRADVTLGSQIAAILPAIGQSIERQTAQKLSAPAPSPKAALAGPSFGRVYALAAILAAPIVAWVFWSAYQNFETASTLSAANRVLDTVDEVRGLPPRVDVAYGGRSLTLSGFVPTAALSEQITRRLGQEVPQATVRNQLAVLSNGTGEVEAAIARWRQEADRQRLEASAAAIAKSLARVQQRLEPLPAILAAYEKNSARQPSVGELRRTLDTALEQSKSATASRTLEPVQLEPLWQTLTRADALVAILMGAATQARTSVPRPLDAQGLAEEAGVLAERISAVAAGLALPARITDLAAKIERLRPPTAREELESYTRSHAIFFGNGTDFRETNIATGVLDHIARRLRENPDVTLRIVGYTDERGTPTLNTNLAQTRADRVATLLMERGIAANRIVAVGRLAAKDLSRTVGVGSANRRVEFEVGFQGESDGSQ